MSRLGRLSNRTMTPTDLPMLRSVRDAYRCLLDAANRLKTDESDVGMLIEYCSIIDYLQGKFDQTGRALTRLEGTAASVRIPAEPEAVAGYSSAQLRKGAA